MRATLLASMAAFVAIAPAAEPVKPAIDLSGGVDGRGLLMAESDKAVYHFHLTAKFGQNGEGTGTLVLDRTPPKVDEFGFAESTAAVPPVKLECSLKFVKKKKYQFTERIGADPVEVEWRLYEITGPKITSRLTLATEGANWDFARLLVADKDGKDRSGVVVRSPPLPIPCHPGCFPAGTPIQVPDGTMMVENIRAGDVVTTIGSDGKSGQGKVASVFATKNRLIEVRTDGATLTTTETQPLALVGGGLRAAGELKAGDRIYSWDGRERRTVTVRSVEATGREAQVFNLILGEPKLFVAGGFLARSKPPAAAIDLTKP